MTNAYRDRWLWVLVWSAIAGAGLLAFLTSRAKGTHIDEAKHIVTGFSLLEEGEFRGEDNTPFVAIYGLPLLGRGFIPPPPSFVKGSEPPIRSLLQEGNELYSRYGIESVLLPARVAAIVLFVGILCLLAFEGRRRGGVAGALIVVTLAGYCPTLLAHGSLVSADLPLCLGTLVTLIAARHFAAAPNLVRGAWLGAAFGFVILTKLTGIAVVAGVGLDWLIRVAKRELPLKQAVRGVCIAVPVMCAALFVAYLGEPYRIIESMLLASQYGTGYMWGYFNFEFPSKSHWFYPAVLAFKSKPILWAFAVASILWPIRNRVKDTAVLRADWIVAATFLAFVMASGYRVGIRFLLPVLMILALQGAWLGGWVVGNARRLAVTIGALLLHVVGTVRLHPDHLTYWNFLAGSERGGTAWFTESNCDWGQDVRAAALRFEELGVEQVVGLFYTGVPPQDLGLEHRSLLSGPGVFDRIDPTKKNVLAMSVSYARLGFTTLVHDGVRRWFETHEPHFTIGNTIWCWWLDDEFLRDLRAAWIPAPPAAPIPPK